MRKFLVFLGALIASTTLAWAQPAMLPYVVNGQNANGAYTVCPVGTVGTGTCSLPVTASVSATVAVAPLTSTNLAGTISVTNTFQSIQVSTAGRNGCLIQNQSTTNPMWVFFGAIGSATKGKSFILDTSHGLAISCAVGGLGVVTDQVSITGTGADAFNANFQ